MHILWWAGRGGSRSGLSSFLFPPKCEREKRIRQIMRHPGKARLKSRTPRLSACASNRQVRLVDGKFQWAAAAGAARMARLKLLIRQAQWSCALRPKAPNWKISPSTPSTNSTIPSRQCDLFRFCPSCCFLCPSVIVALSLSFLANPGKEAPTCPASEPTIAEPNTTGFLQ